MLDASAAAGQVLVGGTYGTILSPTTAKRLSEGRIGGLILMGRNIESPRQVRSLLSNALSSAATGFPPPLLCVDQEGGRVARLGAPIIQLPPARSLGRLNDEALTRRAYFVLGSQLRSLGFTVDFAPVLDIDDGPPREVIGDRSFGGTPELVCRQGVAAVKGLLEAGICPCGKHFPGHGVTTSDSHVALPVVEGDARALGERELRPFVAAIGAALPMIMPAHIVYRGIDEGRPATTSRAILDDLLRGSLEFHGAVITDDLKMGAVSEAGGPVDVAVEALMAGADMLLCCHDEELQESIRDALVVAAQKSVPVKRRLVDAAGKSMSIRKGFLPKPVPAEALEDTFSSHETREVMRAMEERLE